MAYKHIIRAKTKNLFNKNNATIINGYIYSGQLIITESLLDRTIVFPCKPNTTYTFSKMYTNRLFMAETSEETPAIGTTCTNPIANLGEPPSQNYCTLTTTATAKNLIITVCALYNTVTYTLQEILDSVQIELGSTPTPYTPYNYLSSNKRMIKVSDVCQLYDKTYLVTQTKNGVTFTNNGDGSVTVNGTASQTATAGSEFLRVNPGDRILMFSGYDTAGLKTAYVYCHQWDENKHWIADLGYPSLLGKFSTCGKNCRYIRYTYRVDTGNTATNAVIKLQLFNLTEMYGAGHEPATVAEFRQRFPNEYYPYSPQCWLTSYKSAVVCKTKNLFDVNNAVVINYNSQQETTDATHYVKDGIVYSDWNNYYIGTCVGIKGGWTLPAGTYTVSAKIAYNTKRDDEDRYRSVNIGFVCVLADGSKTRYMDWVSSGIPGNRIAYTAQIPAGCKNIMPYLSVSAGKLSSSPAAYCELMVEQGSTATSYVPYQHL